MKKKIIRVEEKFVWFRIQNTYLKEINRKTGLKKKVFKQVKCHKRRYQNS